MVARKLEHLLGFRSLSMHALQLSSRSTHVAICLASCLCLCPCLRLRLCLCLRVSVCASVRLCGCASVHLCVCASAHILNFCERRGGQAVCSAPAGRFHTHPPRTHRSRLPVRIPISRVSSTASRRRTNTYSNSTPQSQNHQKEKEPSCKLLGKWALLDPFKPQANARCQPRCRLRELV